MARLGLETQGRLGTDRGMPGRDRGSGAALPTADLRRGDAYFHTGLACLMVYTGTAWRQAHVSAVADAAARDAISTNHSALLHAGFAARQADVGITWQWNGSAWDPPVPGGDVRYQLTTGVTVATQSGADVAIPFGDAIQTHADITRSGDNTQFTVNRAGVWSLAAGYRTAAHGTGALRFLVIIHVLNGPILVQHDTVNVANAPLDVSASVPARLAAGTVLRAVAHQNAGAAVNLDSNAGGVQRTFFSAVFLRP